MKILESTSIYYLIIIFLLALYTLGIFGFGLVPVVKQLIPPVVATVAAGVLLDYLELKRWTRPLTPLITGLIIGLTSEFGAGPLMLALIGVSAMVIKFVVKWNGRHIFNPAGAGLLVGMFFGSYPSWWAGGENIWIYAIWIPLLLYKTKRWAPMVGFLVPAALIGGVNIIFSGSGLFFLSVMLIEPKTSPATRLLGLLYGLVIAISFFLFGKFFQFDALVSALLLGNLFQVLTKKLLGRYSIL